MKEKKKISKTEKVEKETTTTEKTEAPEKVKAPKSSVILSWRPKKVSVAGDFNDWNPESHPLTLDENGDWKVELELAPGTYEYRFVVDGKWMTDPACESLVKNPFGSYNSVLTVK